MRALQLPDLSSEALKNLDQLYRTTRDLRLRTRAHIVLLAAEKSLLADEIAEIVRTDGQTVRRWLKRYQEEGLAGLSDAPRPGGPRKVTDSYLEILLKVARRPPSEAGLPHIQWTAERLTEYMTAQTDIKVHPETVRLHLKAAGIDLNPSPKNTPTNKNASRIRARRRTPK